jgi:ABC-type transport system involved in cytochrome c biogenesis permease subunit
MLDFNFNFLFLQYGGLFLHLLCPLIAFLSFIFFESHDIENTLRNCLRGMYFTIIYAAILISLNIFKLVNGPYPFLKVYEQSVLMSVFWIIAIMGGILLLSKGLLLLNELISV